MKQTIKRTGLIVMLLMVTRLISSAYDFEVDGIYYNRISSGVEVTYKNTDYNSYSGDIIIPEKVSYNGSTYTVTSIGSDAFRNCTSLKSVEIPNTVTSIGSSAFYSCSGLTSVVIPSAVTSIREYAFAYCNGLTSVVIPPSVKTFYKNAFAYCSGLIKSAYPDNLLKNPFGYGCEISYPANDCEFEDGIIYGKNKSAIWFVPYNYEGKFNIPNSVTSIGESAFSGCSGLTSVEIPNSVTSIGIAAFEFCTSLTSVEIPSSVPRIASYTFNSCSSLTSVVIPSSVTSISNNSFEGCISLTSIVIPSSVTFLGAYAFSGCSSLTSMEIGETLSPIDLRYGVFSSCPIETAVLNCKNIPGSILSGHGKLKNLTIGNSVTSIGESAFSGCRGLTSVVIPNSVTSIGESAFRGCSGLTSVVIPNLVTSIENFTFRDCNSLKNVEIPNSVISVGDDAFRGCSSLTSVEIPNSVTSIGGYAFEGCSSLTSVEIPNSVTSISNNSFESCSSLTSVLIPNSVTSIGNYAFRYCRGLIKSAYPNSLKSPFSNGYAISYPANDCQIEDGILYSKNKTAIWFIPCNYEGNFNIPNSVTSIGTSAFLGCSSLTSVVIPNSVTSIGTSAFSQCNGLIKSAYPDSLNDPFEYCYSVSYPANDCEFDDGIIYSKNKSAIFFVPWNYKGNFSIPNSVTSIGESSFSACISLTNIEIPNSVTSIGKSAFSECYSLSSVVIPNSVTSIEELAFFECSSLSSVVIPNSVTSIEKYAFEGCSGLTSIEIPNSVTSIGESAFSNCSGLTSVKIPNSVTSIGDFVFYGCISLTSVEIPNSVTSIGQSAFYRCRSLTSVEIPNSVTSIGGYAFYYCDNMTEIKVNWQNPIKISSNCFSSSVYQNAILSIPHDDWFRYLMTTDWGQFKNISVESVMIASQNDGTYSYRYLPDSGEAVVVNNSSYKSLNKISIPERTVSDGKFYYVIAIADNAFENCSNAKEDLSIPNGCKYIGEYAFSNCNGLTSVSIPPSLKEVGGYAFNNCVNLQRVNISDLSAWCGITFYKITSACPLNYAHNLYLNGELISDLVIPDDVTEIKFATFYRATPIQSITIPNSVTKIAEYSLGGTSITEIRIPSSVKEYNGLALNSCENLKEITFDQSSEDLIVNRGSLLQGLQLTTLNLCRNLILADGENSGQTSLENVNLGGTITTINDGLFKGNRNLKDIVIPSSVSYIGNSAFENCGLTSIAIGAGIEEIGDKAFAGNSPSTVSVTALESPMAENTTFSYIAGTLMVTPGCEDDYYNNPNCWYQFSYPTPLVVATGLKVTSTKDSKGNVKMVGTLSPSNVSLPYVIWKSGDVNSAVVDPEGNVHFYNGAKSCKIVGSTLYADGPVVTATITNEGNVSSEESGDTGIESVEATFDGTYRVFTIQGINVMNTTNAEDLDNLAKGIYIINGKKVMINK